MKQIALILTLVLSVSLFANNNNEKTLKLVNIKGKVVDTHETLTGVQVMVDNIPTTVYTDFEGNFIINNLTPGKHQLKFSLVAYENKVIEINVEESQNIEVKLESK